MIWEWLRGSESPWAPYIDILPWTSDALIFWDEEELEELGGCTVLDKINKEEEKLKLSREVIPLTRAEGFLSSLNPSLQRKEARRLDSNTDYQNLALRMSAFIMAYSLDLEQEVKRERSSNYPADQDDEDDSDCESTITVSNKAMIPVADMLNADNSQKSVRFPFFSPCNNQDSTYPSSKISSKLNRRLRSAQCRKTTPPSVWKLDMTTSPNLKSTTITANYHAASSSAVMATLALTASMMSSKYTCRPS
jgi:hypothetical protein